MPKITAALRIFVDEMQGDDMRRVALGFELFESAEKLHEVVVHRVRYDWGEATPIQMFERILEKVVEAKHKTLLEWAQRAAQNDDGVAQCEEGRGGELTGLRGVCLLAAGRAVKRLAIGCSWAARSVVVVA